MSQEQISQNNPNEGMLPPGDNGLDQRGVFKMAGNPKWEAAVAAMKAQEAANAPAKQEQVTQPPAPADQRPEQRRPVEMNESIPAQFIHPMGEQLNSSFEQKTYYATPRNVREAAQYQNAVDVANEEAKRLKAQQLEQLRREIGNIQ